MDEQNSQQVCEIIAGVLISDDHIHPNEIDFLKRVQARFGLPEEAKVEPMAHEEAVIALRGLDGGLRKETLELLVKAAAADGRVELGERIFLDAVAKELTIGQDDLEKLLVNALMEPSA